MGINPRKTPYHPDCISCGDCVRACPKDAIARGFRSGGKKQAACGSACAACHSPCAGQDKKEKEINP